MKTVESSQLVLTSYLELIMDAIFSSVDKCPNLLRVALRQLWMRVADRFQDPEHVVSVRQTDRQTDRQTEGSLEGRRDKRSRCGLDAKPEKNICLT